MSRDDYMVGDVRDLVIPMAKLEAYRHGHYVFKPPPVPHARWSERDWIRYIDGSGGRWTVPVLEEEPDFYECGTCDGTGEGFTELKPCHSCDGRGKTPSTRYIEEARKEKEK